MSHPKDEWKIALDELCESSSFDLSERERVANIILDAFDSMKRAHDVAIGKLSTIAGDITKTAVRPRLAKFSLGLACPECGTMLEVHECGHAATVRGLRLSVTESDSIWLSSLSEGGAKWLRLRRDPDRGFDIFALVDVSDRQFDDPPPNDPNGETVIANVFAKAVFGYEQEHSILFEVLEGSASPW